MIESVVISLGRIMETLKKHNLMDKTVIVLTSDHGGLSNSGTNNQRPLATSNLPLRAGKGHLYEGGIKVPMIAYVPGMTKKGKINTSVVTGTDYYPTFLELAGAKQKPKVHVDGVSFVPALKGKTMKNDRDFFRHSPLGRPNSTGDRNATVYRKGNYKLMHYFDTDEYELYDLSKDPNEQHNLATKKPEIKEKMAKTMQAWKKEINAFNKAAKTKKSKNKASNNNKNKNKTKPKKTRTIIFQNRKKK